MKRILLCTILLIGATFSVQAQLLNTQVEETTPGQAWTLTFTLAEAGQHTALSFQLTLPEEIEASASEIGTGLQSTHELLMGQPDNAALQFILYSAQSTLLPTTDATFTLQLQSVGGETLGDAEYLLSLTDIRFADVQGVETLLADQSIVLPIAAPVDPGMPGDVNDDGILSLADMVALLNALEGLPNDTYLEKRADFDGDGKVSRDDVLSLCDYIMEQPASTLPSEALPASVLQMRALDATIDENAKGIAQLQFEAGENLYSALQLHIRLPKGISLESITLPPSLEGMEMRVRLLEDESYRVLLYANGSITLPATPTTLDLNLTTAEAMQGTIQVSAATAVSNQGKEERLTDCQSSLVVQVPTGIQSVQTHLQDAPFYDLQGRKVAPSRQGIFILNGKKYLHTIPR